MDKEELNRRAFFINFLGTIVSAISIQESSGHTLGPVTGSAHYLAEINHWGLQSGLWLLSFGFLIQFVAGKLKEGELLSTEKQIWLFVLNLVIFLLINIVGSLLFI